MFPWLLPLFDFSFNRVFLKPEDKEDMDEISDELKKTG